MNNNNFKQTEIGLIPEDWEVVRLGEVVFEVPLEQRQIKIEKNKYYKRIFTKLYGKGVKVKDVVMGNQISSKIMFIVEKDDFIFSKINIRKGAYGVISNDLVGAVVTNEHPILRAKPEKLDVFFLSLYLLQPNIWQIIKSHAKGFSGKERVKTREFLSITIPLPPLSEQKNIAYVLSTIQEAIEKTDAVIKATKELKKSLMKHLFTYGPVSLKDVETVKLKQTEIGLITKDWEVVRLGEVFTMVRGPFGGSLKKDFFVKDGYAVYEQRNAIYNTFDTRYYIDENKFIEMKRFEIKQGDIIMSCSGTFGKVAIVPIGIKKGIINQALLKLTPNEKILNLYFKYFSESNLFQEIIKSHTHGVTIKNVASVKILKNILIPLPPLPIQQKIAEILSTVDEKIQAEENKKKALEDLFKSMLHNLMSGKIRVKEIKEVSI